MAYNVGPDNFIEKLALISSEAAVMWDRDIAPLYPFLEPFDLSPMPDETIIVRCMKPNGYVLWTRWRVDHWYIMTP